MIPTTRAVIYPTFICNARCKFCYEKYSGRWGINKDFEVVKKEILEAKFRGCDYIDLSGGEPTIYPQICELIKFALDNGIKTCIITNGLASEEKVESIIQAGVDDWLVSVHGLEESHNQMVGVPEARKKQERFLSQINNRFNFRFNCVIHGLNYKELPELAKWMVQYSINIVNFINFNPHNNWGSHPEEAREFIADLRLVESKLDETIEFLEDKNIGVNVRYYPMCRIKEEYRRCICNDLHVMFDPYEWDYSEMPKTFEQYKQWGIRTSKNIEWKEEPCKSCSLQWVCGGINKMLNLITKGKMIDGVKGNLAKDFYCYRKNNSKTLIKK